MKVAVMSTVSARPLLRFGVSMPGSVPRPRAPVDYVPGNLAAVHVERSGSGPPVVFLHGAAGSAATYGWVPDLGRTVVRPDFRGHGRSPRAETYPLGVYVEDAVAVLRETGPAPVVG